MRTLTLPIPPSTNKLFANAGKKGRVKTDAYKAWLLDAGYKLNLQHVPAYKGVVAIHIIVPFIAARDMDNFIKPILDLMKKHGLIVDDSMQYMRRLIIEIWDNPTRDYVTVEIDAFDGRWAA